MDKIDYENDFWIYDSKIDAPRLATPKDMAELRTTVAAFGRFKFLIADMHAPRPMSPEQRFKWVGELAEAVAPILNKYPVKWPHQA